MENNAPAAAEENQEAAETKIRRGKKNKPRKPLWREILEWVVTLAAAVAIALVIRTFIFEPVRVDGHSMDNTLANGEVMFVTKPEYLFGDPEQFDVVICHYPGRYLDRWKLIPQYFVKRLIGLPGETVSMEEGVVYIDGQPLDEPYLDPAHTRRKTGMEPLTLGENEYFVLGDNRDNSNDSRRVGPLARDMLVGHVRAVCYPFRAHRWVR